MKKCLIITVLVLYNLFTISAEPFLILTDTRDREVVIDTEPNRIISLAPGITETIFSLESEDKLIGRTDYCDYPDTKHITSIGTLWTPSIERIVELNPDLIIASTHFSRELLKKLEQLQLNVVIIDDQKSFEGVFNNILTVATLLNRTDLGQELISNMRERVSKVVERISNKPKPSVYYVISYGESGDYTAGGDTFISDLIELAGGENIAKDNRGWAYSIEKILERDPDLIICSKYGNVISGLKKSSGYSALSAVLNGNIYEIDNNLIDRHGPRLIEGLEKLSEIFHPLEKK